MEIIPKRDPLNHDFNLNPLPVETNITENPEKTSNPSNYKLHKDGKAITLIRIIQGLASNDELLLLLTFTLGGYLLYYGVGRQIEKKKIRNCFD